MLNIITPLLITYNEAANIRRTLDKLVWAKRIVVLDSGSTDGTLDIAKSYPQAEIFHRDFDDFASQCNFGLSQIKTTWVLSLDADYELSDPLIAEMNTLTPGGVAGYRVPFVYRIYGRPLRGTLYPPRAVLYRPECASYRQEGHGHRVHIEGNVLLLKGAIYHDDRKSLARWISSQQTYARQEAEYLLSADQTALTRSDRLRLMGWPAPLVVFIYVLLLKGCLLDGWPGWFYVLQRTFAEILIALEVIDRRLRPNAKR